MKRFVVIGGLGFVGQHLIVALQRSHPDAHIVVVDRVKRSFFLPVDYGSLELITGVDITSADDSWSSVLGNTDVVFHLAAMISFFYKDAPSMDRVNVGGTEIVVRCCGREGVRRLVYVSSTAALGYGDDPDIPSDESFDFDWSKASGYAYMLSKFRAEAVAKAAAKDGLEVMIANPATMFGPGDSKVRALLDLIVRGKMPFMMPGGFAIVDVLDMVRGLVALADSGRSGENYILVGGNYLYAEVMQTFADALDVLPPKRTLPHVMRHLLVPLISLKEKLSWSDPGLTREVFAPGFKFRYYSSAKAADNLGWRPEYSLRETIEATVAYHADFVESIKG